MMRSSVSFYWPTSENFIRGCLLHLSLNHIKIWSLNKPRFVCITLKFVILDSRLNFNPPWLHPIQARAHTDTFSCLLFDYSLNWQVKKILQIKISSHTNCCLLQIPQLRRDSTMCIHCLHPSCMAISRLIPQLILLISLWILHLGLTMIMTLTCNPAMLIMIQLDL